MADNARVDYVPPARGFSAEYALQVWRRRKWIGLLVFGAAGAAAAGVVLSLPNLYRATATVLVDRQEVSEAFVRPSVTAELETRIQTIHQRVTSRDRLADLITRLNLYPRSRGVVPMDDLVERMRKDVKLNLQGVNQSSGRVTTISFGLTYSGRDPKTVADVANTLVAAYIADNTQSRERQAGRTADVLQQQLADAQRAVDAEDRKIADYTSQYGSELSQQLDANSASLNRAAADLRQNADAQLHAADRRDRITDAAAVPAQAQAGPTKAMDPIDDQLAKRRQELADLQQQFYPGYPDIVRTQAEIARLEGLQAAAARTRPPTGPATGARPADGRATGSTVTDIDSELKGLKVQEAAIRRDISEYESRMQRAPARQRTLDAMVHARDTARDSYQSLLKQYNEAKLASSLEQDQSIEQFRVLDEAVPPTVPAAPDRLLLALMGLALSIGLGLCAVIVAEKLDTSFHTADDLRAFIDLPVLVTIRQIVTPTIESRQRWRGLALVCVALVALALIGVGAFYAAAGNEHIVRMTARGDL